MTPRVSLKFLASKLMNQIVCDGTLRSVQQVQRPAGLWSPAVDAASRGGQCYSLRTVRPVTTVVCSIT